MGLQTREQRLESLKYVLGLGTVDCFSIGMSSVEQLDENLALIEEAKVAVKEEAEEKPEEGTEEEENVEEEAEVGAAA
jgi:predicted aldo/keto reductase-like oxidoreductase